MIVYGDHQQVEGFDAARAGLVARRAALSRLPTGLQRHAALITLHIEAGRLAQAVADDAFDPEAGDRPTASDHAWMAWLTDCARCVVVSWDDGCSGRPLPPPLPATPAPARPLRLKVPEGYAFYGLYPESYIAAARTLPWQGGVVRVVGLRSIGTSLSAVVAAALDAPPPMSLRPIGHPFRRSARAGREALERFLRGGSAFVVVDEGPGLSGSSFAAAARLLMAHGVTSDRIVFMPGHGGAPGPAADAAIRSIWRSVQVRPSVPISDPTVAGWAGSLLPAQPTGFEDLSLGKWRARRFASPRAWPAIDNRSDRRKLLVHEPARSWVARFAGLGAAGERKLARAETLANMGLTPRPAGLAHGFLIQEWIAPTRALAPPGPEVVGRYIAARRDLPLGASAGADLATLRAMALANTTEALGADVAARLANRLIPTEALARERRPIAIDGAFQPWKWVWHERWLKTDALDHDADHDLIGPQDLAWDVAGALFELNYSARSRSRLLDALGSARPGEAMMDFMTPCYLAFRLGAQRLAAEGRPAGSAERRRNEAAALRYADALRQLSTPGDGVRPAPHAAEKSG
ncbi:hypothetical protein [Brevundimonas sp.]|uniref:hypothetical protein n=1 Tax=Brevundimonas sp. TaxID=1871086 RepID=UPI002D56CBB7|nr:hypothetical protein [Brevundimonas sp.]HYD27225.1 hypothetical protein [Brevundimonas sp.]